MRVYKVTLWSGKWSWDQDTAEMIEAATAEEAVLKYPHPNDDRRNVLVQCSGEPDVVFVTGVERFAIKLI